VGRIKQREARQRKEERSDEEKGNMKKIVKTDEKKDNF
jgi:hypothetical protein